MASDPNIINLNDQGLAQALKAGDAEAAVTHISAGLNGDYDALIAQAETWRDRHAETSDPLHAEIAAALAFEALTQAATPYDRGLARFDQALALAALGRQTEDAQTLKDAASHFVAALEYWEWGEMAPESAGLANLNLGHTHLLLAGLEHSAHHLSEAIEAYEDALETLTEERQADDRTAAKAALGKAQQRLADATRTPG